MYLLCLYNNVLCVFLLLAQIVEVNLTSEGKTKLVAGETISLSYQV